MPNGGHGDLFKTRESDDGWEVMFHNVHARREPRERILARGLGDFAAADDCMWGAINGFDDPDGSAQRDGNYGAGMEAGRALRAQRPG